MFDRPLIPLLLGFIGGIIAGHKGLAHTPSPTIILVALIAFLLLLPLIIPPVLRRFSLIILFFLVGLLADLGRHHPSELLDLAGRGERVVLEGTVLEAPRVIQATSRFVVEADRLFLRDKCRPLQEKVLVTVYGQGEEYLPGDRIRFPARLRPFRNFNNPGGYDYEEAMRLRGLVCAASVSDGRSIVPLGPGTLGWPFHLVEKARKPLRNRIREGVSSANQALYRALILGERQGVGQDLRELFNRAGLGHILAVSGLHIGLVAWLAFVVSKWLLSCSYSLTLKRDIHKWAAFITCFPVVLYTCLAGFQVSGQRAMIMALAYLFSVIMGREKEIWSTLALAALVVLAMDPHALFSISFQLSFCAVMGILWLVPIVNKRIPFMVEKDKGLGFIRGRFRPYVVGLALVTLCAMIFLFPLTALYFHQISLVSVPANLMVVPVLGLWILPLGLTAALTTPLFPPVADLLLGAGAWGLECIMLPIIAFWAELPWSTLWVVTPNMMEIALFYGALFFIISIKRGTWARVGLIVVMLLLVSDGIYWLCKTRYNPFLKVTYLDVGQGNAALVQFPGKERMLIDGGGFSRDTFDVGKMVVAPFLFRSKILHVDYLVLSHPQSDHMNGLRFIASHFGPREFWYNGDKVASYSFKELMGILESKGIKKLLPEDLKNGRDISGVRVDLLHPPADRAVTSSFKRGSALNNASMVLKLSYGGKSCLFAGDLEREGQKRAVSVAGSRLGSNVLLVPHHGSKTSCSAPFLSAVGPRICVISSGTGNPFGFPHAQCIQGLERMGCRILRIDEVGAVRLSMGPEHLEVSGFLEDGHRP